MNYDLIQKCVNQILGGENIDWQLSQNSLKFGDNVYPLTPWRYNRRLFEVRNLAVKTKSLRDICSYKSQRIETSDVNIYSVLYEELDTCEWILADKIISVFADINANKYITLILKTKCGILCNINISATLPLNATPITRHEIVGKEGMISDRAINELIPAESLYLFSEEIEESFTDNDLYMLGLTPNEVMVADNIIQLLTNKPDVSLLEMENARNEYLVSCVKKSAKKGGIVIVGEI